jgi:rubrerythrin
MSKLPTQKELKQLKRVFDMGFGPAEADYYVMPCSVCGMEWGAEEPWRWCPVCGKSLDPKPSELETVL